MNRTASALYKQRDLLAARFRFCEAAERLSKQPYSEACKKAQRRAQEATHAILARGARG